MTDHPPLLFFNDTTVVLNFGLADELDALGLLLAGGRAAWTGTVSHEVARQGIKHGLGDLADAAQRFLGDPWQPQEREHRLIRERRTSFARPGDAPDQHLGEAETLTIIEQRRLNAVFVTDDGHVPPRTSIRCIDTWDLVRACVRRGIMSSTAALAMHACLADWRRVHRPGIRTGTQFTDWLQAG